MRFDENADIVSSILDLSTSDEMFTSVLTFVKDMLIDLYDDIDNALTAYDSRSAEEKGSDQPALLRCFVDFADAVEKTGTLRVPGTDIRGLLAFVHWERALLHARSLISSEEYLSELHIVRLILESFETLTGDEDLEQLYRKVCKMMQIEYKKRANPVISEIAGEVRSPSTTRHDRSTPTGGKE